MIDFNEYKPPVRASGSFIRFRTNAYSYFSAELIIDMGLKEGDFVKFFNDKKNINNWYICKCEDGIKIREQNGSLVFTGRSLARKFRLVFRGVGESFLVKTGLSFRQGDNIYWPIITSALKNNN